MIGMPRLGAIWGYSTFSALVQQRAGGGDMGVEAVDLFGDVGFDGEQGQLLSHPVGIGPICVRQDRGQIGLERGGDHVLAVLRDLGRLGHERFDRGQAVLQHGFQRGAFAGAHLDEIGQCGVCGGEHVSLRRGKRDLVACADHAAQGQKLRCGGRAQRDTCLFGPGFGGREGCKKAIQCGLIEMHGLAIGLLFHADRDVDIAAREGFLHAGFEGLIKAGHPLGRAHPNVEAFGVDATYLNRPADPFCGP